MARDAHFVRVAPFVALPAVPRVRVDDDTPPMTILAIVAAVFDACGVFAFLLAVYVAGATVLLRGARVDAFEMIIPTTVFEPRATDADAGFAVLRFPARPSALAAVIHVGERVDTVERALRIAIRRSRGASARVARTDFTEAARETRAVAALRVRRTRHAARAAMASVRLDVDADPVAVFEETAVLGASPLVAHLLARALGLASAAVRRIRSERDAGFSAARQTRFAGLHTRITFQEGLVDGRQDRARADRRGAGENPRERARASGQNVHAIPPV